MIANNLSKQIQSIIKKAGSTIFIKIFDDSSVNASIYKETKSKKYLTPIPLNGLVYYDPSDEMLSDAGMDKELTQIIVKIPYLDAKSKNLIDTNENLKIDQDDILVVNSIEYKITKVKPSVHFRTHQIFVIGGIRK
jgi:hypothetical protein